MRAAHRAAITKIIAQLKELCHDDPDTPRLLQRKSALLVKCEIIKRLDGEILDEAPEDELEPEI